MTQPAQAITQADWVETEESQYDIGFAKVCLVDDTVLVCVCVCANGAVLHFIAVSARSV
jgi:hypothetical protein